ncbi:3'-5'-RNA exonuclease [Malassezia pachydermatis]
MSSVKYAFSEEMILHQTEILPGDFVEARKSNKTFLGVILPIPEDKEISGAGQGSTLVMVLATGELEQIRTTDIMLHLPQFVELKEAERAGPLKWDYVLAAGSRNTSTSFTTDDELVDAEGTLVHEEEPFDRNRFVTRANICRKIRDMQRETDREIRRLFPAFRNVFLQDANKFEEEPNVVADKHVQEVQARAEKLLKSGLVSTYSVVQILEMYLSKSLNPVKINASTFFAAHTLLMGHPSKFLADSISHRKSQLFTYRSEAEQKVLENVTKWIQLLSSENSDKSTRDAAAIIDGFCERARHILKWDAKRQAVGELPKKDDPVLNPDGKTLFQWTETDRDIIEFLKISLGNRRELQDNITGSIAMSIIKRVGVNVCLSPILHTDSHGKLQIDDNESKDGIAKLETTVTEAGFDLQHAQMFNFLIRIGALTPWENPNALDTQLKNLHKNDEYTEQEYSELKEEKEPRTDFGQLPVYVIDAESSFELDDGVSIETTSDPTHCWVHVHIADPTAWIPHDHELAKWAEHKYTSIYFPEAMWPMLPPEITNKGMSLTNKYGQPMNVMTFSALVNRDSGKVRDYKVCRGRISNIHVLSYKYVNGIYSDRQEEKVSQKHAANLISLAQIASVLLKRRVQVGDALNAMDVSSEVEVKPIPLPSLACAIPESPQFYSGSPKVNVEFANPDEIERIGTYDGIPGGISSESMVSELMILAGRVAAAFGLDHDIPLPYRVQTNPTKTDMEYIQKQKNPVTGMMAMSKLATKDIFLPVGTSSTVPDNHFALGIKKMTKDNPESDVFYRGGYVRVSSPLRRYSDLLCHWQIKAKLSNRKLPYNAQELSGMVIRFNRMDNWSKQLEKSSKRFWIWTFIDQILKKNGQKFNSTDERKARNFKDSMVLGELEASPGIMNVRFNADTLESRLRVTLLHLGMPADCIWPNGKQPPKAGELKKVKILKTIEAGAKRTILCEPI